MEAARASWPGDFASCARRLVSVAVAAYHVFVVISECATIASEAAMHDPLKDAITALFCPTDEPWVMLDEHQVHSRIPDLVVGRIDVDCLEARIGGGWSRALNQSELRALHSMRRPGCQVRLA